MIASRIGLVNQKRALRVTIITQWFPPEHAPFGQMMAELAEDLAASGYSVRVITGFPNHPAGQLFPGFRKALRLRTLSSGYELDRVWLATFRSRSVFARAITFLSFSTTSACALLFGRRPDVVVAVLQPLSQGLLMPIICRLRRTKLVMQVQDLHPDTQIRLGMIRSRALIAALRAIERFAYRRSDTLAVISDSFREHCIRSGAEPRRVAVIPNWIRRCRATIRSAESVVSRQTIS
jgi:colanic acid biosynthesis glycosyl transferase WcaI